MARLCVLVHPKCLNNSPALHSKCLNKSLPLHPKCLKKSVALHPKYLNKSLLCTQNAWTKVLLWTQNVWIQVFPNIPRWYCVTYSTWIHLGIQTPVLVALAYSWLDGQICHSGWMSGVHACMHGTDNRYVIYGERWVNQLAIEARLSWGTFSWRFLKSIEVSAHLLIFSHFL